MTRFFLIPLLWLAVPVVAQTQEEGGPGSAPAAEVVADRVAVIGVMDKRLGTATDFTLKPGESFQFGRLHGVLRTCERTQPHERPQTGAFMMVTETPRPRTRHDKIVPHTVFSGWLFAESPSLNPMRHPTYDVWLKSCTINLPDGPRSSETGSARNASAGSSRLAGHSTDTSGAAAD